MEILIGCAGLIALAAVLTIFAALYDDGFALRVAILLLARVQANIAYKLRFETAAEQFTQEFDWLKPREKRQTEQAQ